MAAGVFMKSEGAKVDDTYFKLTSKEAVGNEELVVVTCLSQLLDGRGKVILKIL